MSNLTTKSKISWSHPLMYQKGRLSVWQKARGMWRNKKPDPIKELARMRKEWN